VGGLGPSEIDEQKKGHQKFFFRSPQPLSFSWFPRLFLPPLQTLNVKEIFLFLVGGTPSGLVGVIYTLMLFMPSSWWEACVLTLASGVKWVSVSIVSLTPPKSGPETGASAEDR
jgi:hypothetical protein